MTIQLPGRPENVPNERYLASLYLVLIVAYADERLCEEERVMLRKQVLALCRTVEDVRGFKSFVDSLPAQLESDGWVERALENIRQNLTETDEINEAFAMALEVAAADGKIQMRETAALVDIADQLGIDSEFAQARLRRVRKTSTENLPDVDKTPWEPEPRKD